MSNSRISLDNPKLDEEIFKRFLEDEYNTQSVNLARYKMNDILSDELTEKQYCILYMYYYKHLSQCEIASILKLNQSTISRTLNGAKRKIGKILKYLL